MPLSDGEDTVLQLSRFAYNAASSRRPDPGPSRPATTLVKKDRHDNLPHSLVAQLSKCIGCGLEWTSKKTANQKRSHIKQCAKKHSLTEDTVKILVEKEIAILAPAQNTSPSHIHSSETTLLDSVVPAGPPKKSRRQQVLSTVKSLPETRDSILSRARNLLGPTITQEDDSESAQQFGLSALARRGTDRSKYDVLSSHASMNEPPSTQPFGVSALRRGAISVEQSIDAREYPCPQFGASLFAQDSILTTGYKRKRSASPPPLSG